MMAALTPGKLIVAAAAATVIDPAWAIPLNTLLLIIMAMLHHNMGKNVKVVKENSGHAADAAAAAASSAEATARIAQEVGGVFRDAAAKAATEPTVPTVVPVPVIVQPTAPPPEAQGD